MEEGGSSPNTAHAVLGEGSLECLALSKRGLFAGGKVISIPRVITITTHNVVHIKLASM